VKIGVWGLGFGVWGLKTTGRSVLGFEKFFSIKSTVEIFFNEISINEFSTGNLFQIFCNEMSTGNFFKLFQKN
jgi:hypothetical protein